MNLKVLLPTEVLLDETVTKVTGEAENGSFTLLPRHIDFVTALVPGVFSYEDDDGREHFLAVNEGILVKSGDEVLVSVREAVRGGELGKLRRIVEEQFTFLDEREKTARTAMATIE
ncbi:MAG: F0F1 ATP synthase subunit epsilon, partial [Desulfobacteraceae bacterium]